MYTFKYINGHVEVYQFGQFILSADTKSEAIYELDKEFRRRDLRRGVTNDD